MRRALVLLAVVAGAFVAPASAGSGLVTSFTQAPECGFHQLCFDIGLSRGARTAAAHVDKFELWVIVTYLRDGKEVATQTVNVRLPLETHNLQVPIRGTVVVPPQLAGKFMIQATAAFGFGVYSRTGIRAFYIDETGILLGADIAPCSDTDNDPDNDCPPMPEI